MSSAPSISLYSVGTMVAESEWQVDNQFYFAYEIYADETMFYTWTDWVNDITSSPDNTQIRNAAEYQNYVLKIKCNFYDSPNDACGLAHPSKGAIMIEAGSSGSIDAVVDTSTAESNTYTLTNAQLAAWKAETTSATALSTKSSSEVTFRSNTSVNDPFFQIFYCGGSRDFVYTCYKY